MCHVTDRQRGAFTDLVFHTVVSLVLIRLCSGQPEPVGPSQPIVAMVGDDVVLPCQLVPVANAFVMTVEWARRDLDPRFVLLWRDGVELESIKHPSYRGRTSLSTDRLEHGDVSLKLSSVRISDEGRYRCFIPGLHESPTVQLVVGAVSSPQILMTETSDGSVLLRCDAKGWYPEPEVVWLDGEGDHVPAGPAETLRGPDGLYAVGGSLTVEKRRGNVTCRVQQKTTNQTRETHVQVPDHSSEVGPRVLIGSLIGCAALVFIPAVLFVVLKRQQKKRKTQRRSPEDGPEQTEEVKDVTSNGDNTGVQDGEHDSLIAGREEENKLIQSDQLVAKSDGEEKEENDVESRAEEIPLSPTEGETHRMQDMKNEGEGRQTMKPVTEDSGLPLVPVEDGEKEQQLNVHAAQKVRKEEETNQPPEMQKIKEREEDEKELKPQNSCLLGDKKQEGDAAQEDAKEQDQEGKQRIITETNEGKEEKTWKETEEEKVQNEKKLQSEEQENIQKNKKRKQKEDGDQTRDAIKDQGGNKSDMKTTTQRTAEDQTKTLKESEEKDLKTQEGVGNQQVLDTSKQEAVRNDGEEGNATTTTERRPKNQTEQINDEPEETKRDEIETKRPSVGREATEKPDLKTTKKQNPKLQAENQRNQTKEQSEEPAEGVKEECEEGQGEGMETDEGAASDGSQKKEITHEGLNQREEKRFTFQVASGVKQQEDDEMEIGRSHDNGESNTKKPAKRRREQEEELHVAQEPSKRRHLELKPEAVQVEVEEVNMEQEVIDEPLGRASNSQPDQAGVLQRDQQEEQMELDPPVT